MCVEDLTNGTAYFGERRSFLASWKHTVRMEKDIIMLLEGANRYLSGLR